MRCVCLFALVLPALAAQDGAAIYVVGRVTTCRQRVFLRSIPSKP
jgi:hypothetical protein